MEMLGARSRPVTLFLRLTLLLLLLAVAATVRPVTAAAVTLAEDSSAGVLDPASPEYRTNGKIFGTYPGQGFYTCSGTVLNTPSRSIVITAGHCVTLGGHLAQNLSFVPAYDHGARPFGTFTGAAVHTMPQWRKFNNPDFDVAAIQVDPNELGTLGDVVGVRDWTVNRSRFSEFEIFGYPGGVLQGEALRSCMTRGLGGDRLTNRLPGPPTVPGICDMARGSSGGGWLVEGRVGGVTSYGYPLSHGRLFSPYFGSAVGNFLGHLP